MGCSAPAFYLPVTRLVCVNLVTNYRNTSRFVRKNASRIPAKSNASAKTAPKLRILILLFVQECLGKTQSLRGTTVLCAYNLCVHRITLFLAVFLGGGVWREKSPFFYGGLGNGEAKAKV